MVCTQSSSKATPYGSATDSTTKPSAGGRPPNKFDDPRRLILSASSWTKTQHHDGLVADRYKVLDELGRGGFGAVSLVERLNDGVTLACKSCTTLDEKSRERLLMEAELWETVSSPYHSAVLQLVEVLKAPDGLHLITELMPFGELYDALDHITRIDRVLRQPLGHLLLVGASGAGKTVLSKFVSWMNGLSVPPRTTFFRRSGAKFFRFEALQPCASSGGRLPGAFFLVFRLESQGAKVHKLDYISQNSMYAEKVAISLCDRRDHREIIRLALRN